MKISVVITTYRRPDTLRRAILSVIGQSYEDFEIIVVNDNGLENPDNVLTRSVVDSFSKKFERLIYIEHKENLNGAAARNSGISAATGDLITFLDDDDIFLPKRLERVAQVFQEDTRLHCVYSGVGFTQGSSVINQLKPQLYEDYVYQLLLQNSFIGTGSNFVCKTSLVRELGGFDVEFLRHQDIEFLIRYLHEYPNIRAIDEILVFKTLDDNVNYPSSVSFQRSKDVFFAKFGTLIDEYSSTQKMNIMVANARQQVTVAAMEHKWPSKAFAELHECSSNQCIQGYVAPRAKWLILQLPGLARLRKVLTVFKFRLFNRVDAVLLESAFLGRDFPEV